MGGCECVCIGWVGVGVCECMCVCLCGYAIVLLGVYGVYMYYAKNMDEYYGEYYNA